MKFDLFISYLFITTIKLSTRINVDSTYKEFISAGYKVVIVFI